MHLTSSRLVDIQGIRMKDDTFGIDPVGVDVCIRTTVEEFIDRTIAYLLDLDDAATAAARF